MFVAVRCSCGCRDWHVAPVADVQGVHFTKGQAELVASVLNERLRLGIFEDDNNENNDYKSPNDRVAE